MDDVGAKWSLKALRRKLEGMGVDHHTLWKRIHHVIIMTFLSCENQVNAAIDMHVPYKNKNCFQLFGTCSKIKNKKFSKINCVTIYYRL